ncbi:uncharacterized protein LOC126779682 isoform X2 [Nymphalis io]|uniref:uncharacterized protein LOC126779682 isoform X2 n=1 Tax=Inachis io TaxID=171585 RepID=UPI0021697126|nr:uncharacterized protein LOC126779682 isoform X2 [Nymphalis io]
MLKIIAIVSIMLLGSSLWAASISCDSCGSECASACGTRHFRSCCFNYLRKKRGPDSLKFHNFHDWTDNLKPRSYYIDDIPDTWSMMAADYKPYPFEDTFENRLQAYEP